MIERVRLQRYCGQTLADRIARAACGSGLLVLFAAAALAQDAQPAPADPKAADGVVPYCIEPMQSMPEKILALIEQQFRCAPGAHLARDSRPARVVPTGEESSGRPFVLRFGSPETANAWFVRGFSTDH
jgi:hypothetical protein